MRMVLVQWSVLVRIFPRRSENGRSSTKMRDGRRRPAGGGEDRRDCAIRQEAAPARPLNELQSIKLYANNNMFTDSRNFDLELTAGIAGTVA